MDIYFPAPDEKGELIKDRNFYLTSSSVLKRLGYYTKGHVVAKNEETDLAIIRLDGLPETREKLIGTPPHLQQMQAISSTSSAIQADKIYGVGRSANISKIMEIFYTSNPMCLVVTVVDLCLTNKVS